MNTTEQQLKEFSIPKCSRFTSLDIQINTDSVKGEGGEEEMVERGQRRSRVHTYLNP